MAKATTGLEMRMGFRSCPGYIRQATASSNALGKELPHHGLKFRAVHLHDLADAGLGDAVTGSYFAQELRLAHRRVGDQEVPKKES